MKALFESDPIENVVLPMLFQYDSKDRARQWQVSTDGAQVVVQYGLVGGKIAEKRTTAKAKNIGKANATTPEQQAILEAESKWRHQINREDYAEDIDDSGHQFRPMLAQDYLKVPHRLLWAKWRVAAQVKLDGLRLSTGNRDRRTTHKPGDRDFEMLTRQGEVYKVPHLSEPAGLILDWVQEKYNFPYVAVDGEAYLHGVPLQTISSYAKKYQRGKTDKLEYWLFDLAIPGVSFEERHRILCEAYAALDLPDSIVIVEYEILKNHDEYVEFRKRAEADGYEGAMARDLDSEYAFANRSVALFKFKFFFDDQFRIIEVWEDKNGNAMFTVEMVPGQRIMGDEVEVTERKTFDVTPKLSHAERKKILLEPQKWIGEWYKVKYQDLTIDGIPSFPVGLGKRKCNDLGVPLS